MRGILLLRGRALNPSVESILLIEGRQAGSPPMKRGYVLALMVVGMSIPVVLLSCGRDGNTPQISFQRLEEEQSSGSHHSDHDAIRFAVAAVNSPQQTFTLYQDLLQYLGKRLDRPVELVQGKTYAEINDLVRSGDATLAIVCSAPYVLGHDQFGMEALVVPEVKGETTYHSYVIVSQDSAAKSFEDLRGKTYAFSDPMSNSGRLVPLFLLWQMGETPESFFSRYIFTYSHDNSIKAVAEGLVDGASVDSLVYDFAVERDPQYTGKTRVIQVSPPYAINPIVVSPRLDPALKEELREALLDMNNHAEGQRILAGLRFDRFVPIDDSAYDSIRAMLSAVNEGQTAVYPGGE